MGSHPWRSQLRQNQPPPVNMRGQFGLSDATDEFLGAEGSLASGTPDVHALGVEDENPGVQVGQVGAKSVEREFVVRSHEDRRLPIGCAQSVEPGRHAHVHTAHAPAGLPVGNSIAPGQIPGREQNGDVNVHSSLPLHSVHLRAAAPQCAPCPTAPSCARLPSAVPAGIHTCRCTAC